MLQVSDDADLAHCISERTMTICVNVMTLLNQPMNDSVYGLTSNNRQGGLILIGRPISGLFAVSSCQTTNDRIIVTTKTTISSCTMTCTFKFDVYNMTYSFCDKDVNNETMAKKTNFDSDANMPVAKPIPIRPPIPISNIFDDMNDLTLTP